MAEVDHELGTLVFKQLVVDETKCSTCWHNTVCHKQPEYLCTNFEREASYEKGCASCTHYKSKIHPQRVPCFVCKCHKFILPPVFYWHCKTNGCGFIISATEEAIKKYDHPCPSCSKTLLLNFEKAGVASAD